MRARLRTRPVTIYRIVRIGTNECYVGSALNLVARKRAHLRALCRGGHSSIRLQRAWDKYGQDAFKFEALEVCIEWQREEREQHYLDALNSVYSLSRVVRAPSSTPEIAALVGDALRGRSDIWAQGRAKSRANKPGWVPTHRIGAKDSPETIAQRTSSRLATIAKRKAEGRVYKQSDKQKAAVSAASIARRGEKRSPEAKEKMRQAQLKAWADGRYGNRGGKFSKSVG